MVKPIIRHLRQLSYDDSASDIGEIVDGLLKDRGQDAIEAADTRLDWLEGLDSGQMDTVTLELDGTPEYAGFMSESGGAVTMREEPGVVDFGDPSAHIVTVLTFDIQIPAGTDEANRGHLGELFVVLNGAPQTDTVDLATSFVGAERYGAQTTVPWNSSVGVPPILAVTSCIKFGETAGFQMFKAEINLDSADFDGAGVVDGANTIIMRHTVGGADFDSDPFTFVYDSAGTQPTAAAPTIVQNTINSAVYVSGVRKYGLTDTFDIGVVITNGFNNTFVANPIGILSADCSIPNYVVAWNAGTVAGPSTPPQVTEVMTYTEAGLAMASPPAPLLTENGRIGAYGTDPAGDGATTLSAVENRMINTMGIDSTALDEPLVDENRRLSHFSTQGNNATAVDQFDIIVAPGNLTGAWNGQTALDDGEAMLWDGTLDYPAGDFSAPGFLPPPADQPGAGADYSGFAVADQFYVRGFYDAGVPHSNGTLQLVNWVLANFSGAAADVWIKLPTKTNWMDLGAPYNVGLFPVLPYPANPGAWGAAGTIGCRTSDAGDQFGWTAGAFSTAGSGFEYILRIRITAASPALNSIEEIGW